MTEVPEPIDVSTNAQLRHIAEEVMRTKTPRLLARDDEPVAMVVPLGEDAEATSLAHDEGIAAALSVAGAWHDLVDGEELKEQLRATRGSDRPAATL